MATAEQLDLRPGQPFLHLNEARACILGVVSSIDPKHIRAWVNWCSLGTDIDELFPDERQTVFAINDPGFSRLPSPSGRS